MLATVNQSLRDLGILKRQHALVAWTEDLACAPLGGDVTELCRDIAAMWMDAMCWEPVLAESLEVGMSFVRTVDQKTRNELAEFIDRGGSLLKQQAI